MIFTESKTIALRTIPGTPYIALDADTNFTPKAIAEKTLLLERAISELPEVKALDETHTALDVGAFIGDTAIILGHNGARVVAFESQCDAFLCAFWNTIHDSNIFINHGALGDGEKVSCNEDPIDGNLGTRTTTPDRRGAPSICIDDLNLGKIDFIKIDVEGAELHVLLGAVETLKRDKPILLIEIFPEMLAKHSSSKERIYDFLTKLGYFITEAIGNSSEPRWDILAKPQPNLTGFLANDKSSQNNE